jgi:hypothetical protein
MLETHYRDFTVCVWNVARRIGLKPPAVADEVITDLFPNTRREAVDEGADKMLRNGVIAAVKRVLKQDDSGSEQLDLSNVDESFRPIVAKLGSHSYHVEALEERVPIATLIANPDLLDDARKFMRRKGEECLAEAERLDQLYNAVMATQRR